MQIRVVTVLPINRKKSDGVRRALKVEFRFCFMVYADIERTPGANTNKFALFIHKIMRVGFKIDSASTYDILLLDWKFTRCLADRYLASFKIPIIR